MTLGARIRTLRNGFLFHLVSRFILVAAAVTLLVSALYIVSEIRSNQRSTEAMGRLTATGLAESARLPLFSGNVEELSRLARFAISDPGIRRASFLDRSGRVLAEARQPTASPVDNFRTLSVAVRRSPSGVSPEHVLTGEAGVGDVPIGSVLIEYRTVGLAAQIGQTARLTGTFGFLFLFLVSAVSLPVLRRAMRSFDELLAGLRAIGEGDYDRVLPVDGGSELGIAAANVNELAASLKQRDEENRRLHRSLECEVRERAQAEAEARESERTLRDLMDAMPVGVAWTDLAGNIQFMNRYTIECFGYGYEALRTVDDVFPLAFPDPDYRRRVEEARRAANEAARARGADVSTYEGMVTCRDGTVRHVIFNNQRRKGRIVITLLDITEREAMQDRIIRAQKMESLGILAGGIAHNFNNALTSVIGYIGYARRKLDDPAKTLELLKKAEGASCAAAGIAGQLLTFARGGEPVKAPLAVAKVVWDAVSLSLGGTNVDAAVEIPKELHGIEADEGQLGQVFNNLLINAVQAMPGGGTISIRCANVGSNEPPPMGLPPGEYVRIDFSDQGCGVPEHIREKIFDPYFTTKAGMGSGLGLASVRSIIEKHGGTVAVQSEPHRGATFTLHLPSTGAVAHGERPRPENPAPEGGKKQTILFLDDEAAIRNLARETLEHFGYRVTTCVRGEDAISLYREAKAQGAPYSAAVLDLTIPTGMGGREVAERILAFDPEALLVVSSGYSNSPVMADHRKFGFRAAVPKPYKDDALTRTLSDLLQRSPA
jgi:PAS domain S-box-containing protein